MGPEDQHDPLEECYNKYEDLKKVAAENAQLANDRAAIIVNLTSELKQIKKEIRRFGEDKAQDDIGLIRVRLKSGVNLGEVITKFINDDRWEDFESNTPRRVLQDLEQDFKSILIEISDSIPLEK